MLFTWFHFHLHWSHDLKTLKGARLGSSLSKWLISRLRYTQKRQPVTRIQSLMNTTDLDIITQPQPTSPSNHHSTFQHYWTSSEYTEQPITNKHRTPLPPPQPKSPKMHIEFEEIAFTASWWWVACPQSDDRHTRFGWILRSQIFYGINGNITLRPPPSSW